MNRFNEGKAYDAIIRHLETREGGLRQDVRSPERAGHRAPVELTCMIGAHRFAFEHTGIEPFEGQIKLETQAYFHPLRDMFSGPIPPGEQYELQVPFGATLTLPKAQINSVISALGGWIRREGPKLTLAPIGRYGTPAVRQPDAIVPFKAALYRNSLPGAPGHLLVTHRVDELDDSRTARIERACRQKFPKLAVWKNGGMRTILILEENDIQLTNVVDVCRSLLQVEGSFQFKPNEVYLITTSITPWFVWCLRIGSASFFDLAPDDRGWEIDPKILVPLTNR
jgi:hypothetical protein